MKRLLSVFAVLGLLFACTEETNSGRTNEVFATAIALNKAEVTIEKGSTVDLTVSTTPVNVADLKIEWSSSNPSVASVDNGKVTAVAAGTAEILAKSGDLTAKCAITVVVSTTSIKLNKTSIELEQGQSDTLTATLEPADATDEIAWKSSDKSIAVVESGVVAAVSPGTATITASAGTLSATCEVVVKGPVPEGSVDLGLSVYWATCNLSENGFVSSPEEYGDYFAWGEVEPKTSYNWASYKWANGDSNKLTKYCPANKTDYWDGEGEPDGKTVLDPEDDAAHVILGGKWRMPTKSEQDDLRTKCTWTWDDAKKGYTVTGTNGNSIFLPAAGYRYDAGLDLSSSAFSWSSSLEEFGPSLAWNVNFGPVGVVRGSLLRYNGSSVRPVSE